MFSLLRLIQNEQMKIYARLRTWIMLAIHALVVIGVAVLMKATSEGMMDHVLQFMGVAANLTTLSLIFSIIVAGDAVASEFAWGTIKLLLIRPVTRSKILLAKYVSAVLFMLTNLLLLLVVSYLIGLLLFGVSGTIAPGSSFPALLETYGLKAIGMLMAVTLAFMISAAFRSSSLAIGLSIFLMLTANSFTYILTSFMKADWAKYLLFANTDLSPYVYGTPPVIPGMTLGFSVTVLVVYWLLFYVASWLLFTKRDVAGT